MVDGNCPFINHCKKALLFELGYGSNAFFLPKIKAKKNNFNVQNFKVNPFNGSQRPIAVPFFPFVQSEKRRLYGQNYGSHGPFSYENSLIYSRDFSLVF